MIRVAVGILTRDSKILIAERPLGKPYSGFFEFPGGKIEHNETALHALTRELREELGVEIKQATPFFEHVHTYPDKSVRLEVWIVKEFVGEPESKENQTLRWVSFTELLTLRLLEGNWAIIDRIRMKMKGSSTKLI